MYNYWKYEQNTEPFVRVGFYVTANTLLVMLGRFGCVEPERRFAGRVWPAFTASRFADRLWPAFTALLDL